MICNVAGRDIVNSWLFWASWSPSIQEAICSALAMLEEDTRLELTP
jgi:hypothetical protein